MAASILSALTTPTPHYESDHSYHNYCIFCVDAAPKVGDKAHLRLRPA